MKHILTAILVAVSLLILDARVAVCQKAVTTQENTAAPETVAQPQDVSKQQQDTGTLIKPVAQAPAPLDEKARKIKRVVDKVGVAGKLTLFLKNGDKLHGNVVSIDDESFQITEVDLKQVITLHYKNVKKVREGYGNKNLLTGRRSNPSKGFNIALAAAVAFIALVLPILAIRGSK